MNGRSRFPRLGLLAALFALAVQLAVGATVPFPPSGSGHAAICHAGEPGEPPNGPAHHMPDCALCPLCVALHHPAPLPGAPPAMPAPRLLAFPFVRPTPPATGPPSPAILAAQPRGPPVSA